MIQIFKAAEVERVRTHTQLLVLATAMDSVSSSAPLSTSIRYIFSSTEVTSEQESVSFCIIYLCAVFEYHLSSIMVL